MDGYVGSVAGVDIWRYCWLHAATAKMDIGEWQTQLIPVTAASMDILSPDDDRFSYVGNIQGAVEALHTSRDFPGPVAGNLAVGLREGLELSVASKCS